MVEVTHILTAGHCGYSNPSATWNHSTLTLGPRTGTLFPAQQIDAMRIRVPTSQMSNNIYGYLGSVGTPRNPVAFERICVSAGNFDLVDCNLNVADDYTSWTSNTCNCTMWGARFTGYNPIAGDSGSPLFTLNRVPVGLLANNNGNFARMGDAMYRLGEPFGNLEAVTRVPGYIYVKGWTIDPDAVTGIGVNAYVDSTLYPLLATGARPDVAAAYPGYGQYHGFEAYLSAPFGPNNVCVWFVNTSWGPSHLQACAYVP